MNDSLQKPIARSVGLVIQEMPDEVLVYDLETNKAHCLNETAAFIWSACNGKNSISDITRLFVNQSNKSVDESLVWLAIDQLSEINLLEFELRANFQGQTRREVIKKIGLASVIALPIVASLVAPIDALANTTCSQVVAGGGGGCTTGNGTPCSGIPCTACADAGCGCVCNSGTCQARPAPPCM